MKESFYFAHDFNAHDDPKIRAMMRKNQLEGYGIFWTIIELLASETGRWYLPKDYDGLAYEMRTQSDRIKSVVEEFGLFEFDDKNFWNNRLDSHFSERAKKSEQARKAAKRMHEKRRLRKDNHAVAQIPQCKVDAIKERKGKEKKGNESKTKKKINKKQFLEFVFLKKEEHEKLLVDFGEEKLNKCIEKLDNFIPNSKTSKSYKDHNRVLRGWVSEWYDEQNAGKAIVITKEMMKL